MAENGQEPTVANGSFPASQAVAEAALSADAFGGSATPRWRVAQ